jgi:serine/arginine repetitive matrix protein 2
VFSRPPDITTRSRSSTCTTSSAGIDTPPLSASDGSSISGGSQSSIDLAAVDFILSNTTHPLSNTDATTRARARGHGHRRRASASQQARRRSRGSVYSVYETIEEEEQSNPSSPDQHTVSKFSQKSSPTTVQPILVVDPDSSSDYSRPSSSIWDDDRGIVALRRYYELRNEADHTVAESKRIWLDTPFSLYALQSMCFRYLLL